MKTFRPLEVYTVVALIYFAIIFVFSQLTIRPELSARQGKERCDESGHAI